MSKTLSKTVLGDPHLNRPLNRKCLIPALFRGQFVKKRVLVDLQKITSGSEKLENFTKEF